MKESKQIPNVGAAVGLGLTVIATYVGIVRKRYPLLSFYELAMKEAYKNGRTKIDCPPIQRTGTASSASLNFGTYNSLIIFSLFLSTSYILILINLGRVPTISWAL